MRQRAGHERWGIPGDFFKGRKQQCIVPLSPPGIRVPGRVLFSSCFFELPFVGPRLLFVKGPDRRVTRRNKKVWVLGWGDEVLDRRFLVFFLLDAPRFVRWD